jgi:hypothetical protein
VIVKDKLGKDMKGSRHGIFKAIILEVGWRKITRNLTQDKSAP